MEIVQSDTESMLIISCNDEASGYLANIPSEYQEVEYIQSSGTQYLIIWNTFKTSYKTVIDLQMDVIGADYIPVWLRNSSNYRYGIDAWNGYFTIISWGNNWTNTKQEDKNRHIITVDKNIATVDGTNYSISYTNATFSHWIWVFCYNNWETPESRLFSSNKLYKLDIYNENWVKIYDLYPAYRKSDNVIGLYDLVNDVFYTNIGSGTFTKWPNYKRND